ncbi:hypothetical protein CCR75_004390 [Bremia lactucae]|uniref:FYVE-type domain-containing protein n=1 Tax=Bremia lactucae TaxID=4779 RepID=A0A976FNA3_BRELC|nr:hypothetical protein CCR75_004390 [Bremia lactucae]
MGPSFAVLPNMTSIFPLPDDYFPLLPLSKKEAQRYLEWGNSLLQATIDAYHRDQFDSLEVRERQWKPIKQKNNLTVYRRRQHTAKSEYRYLCTGHIDGTLDEVVMGRYADNTYDFRRISGVYREDLVDCAVLGIIHNRSPNDPFFLSCFKWMTVESPGKGLVKQRDVCFYEQMGITRDHNGKEIGYTLTESVDLPNCPPFPNCVRAKLSVCYLYQHNKSGGVAVYMRGKNDAGGKVIDWVADLKSAELWLRIDRARPVAHAVIATVLIEAGKSFRRPVNVHGKCELCFTKASTFLSSSKTCAVCRRLTCSNCGLKVRVLSTQHFTGPEFTHFCKKCVRLIHQVDLRAPESVQNLVEYAARSLSEAAPSGVRITAVSNASSGGEVATTPTCAPPLDESEQYAVQADVQDAMQRRQSLYPPTGYDEIDFKRRDSEIPLRNSIGVIPYK